MFLDAVENDPDDNAMRQIPIEDSSWSSSIWISENAVIRKRYFNIFNNNWTWGKKMKHHIDEMGNPFIFVKHKKIDLVTAVAMAWIVNSKNRKKPKFREDTNDSTLVMNIYWTDDESSDDISLEDSNSEEWTPLIYSHLSCAPKCKSYEISNHGRIRNSYGEVSTGTFVNNENLVCLKNGIVINLKKCEERSFHARSTSKPIKQPPRLKKLIDAMKTNVSLIEYSKETKLQLSTIWTYIYDIVKDLDLEDAYDVAKRYISDSAWNAIHTIFESEHEDIFSLPISEYMKAIDFVLCDDMNWKCNPHRYSEIRILKLVCEKIAVEQQI